MLDYRMRKLLKPINLLVCTSILMGLITACVPRPRRRYVAPTPEAPAAQDGGSQVGQEPVPQPVPTPPAAAPAVAAGGGGIEPVRYNVPLPPRPPGLASYRVQAPAAHHVEVSDAVGASISMEPGWHLVSLPEEPVDTDPAAVLASIAGSYARVYAYDGCDQDDPWKLYDPADPGGSDLTAIDHRVGLWVEMTQTDTLDISWTRPESTLIRLCRGWNLIGYPVGLALPVESALESIDGRYDRVFGWDGMDVVDPWAYYDVDVPNWANDLQMLEPGRGYWVHATQDANLIVTPPTTPPEMDIPGCIASPEPRSRVSERVDVVLKEDVTLRSVMVDYWPVNDLNAVQVLSTAAEAAGGSTVARLDPTVLANGSYAIRVSGTDGDGERVACGTMVTVEGEYKPGRVRFTVTDLTVPVAGLPIQVGRTYDSLERHQSGDFGYGWSLAIGNPKLEVDPDHNVTVTMPNGKRATFYYAPQMVWGFGIPQYVPQPGVYGSLEAKACGLVVISGGQWFCFPGNLYQKSVSGYVYTDPYGREYDMGLDGRLNTIKDLNGNTLTFSADGIRSSVGGLEVAFERDGEDRITSVTDPLDNVYGYEYDAAGNLVRVNYPGLDEPVRYTYDADHYFLSAEDPRGNALATTTYYPDGRLESETDALGHTYRYEYDPDARATTVVNPDGGRVTTAYDSDGLVLSETDPLSRTTTYEYDDNRDLASYTTGAGETAHFTYDGKGNITQVTNGLGETVITITYNKYGGPSSITDGLGNTQSIEYDEAFMPTATRDSLGVMARYTWNSHGSLLSRQDGNGDETRYTYDDYGNLIREVDPVGDTTHYTYDLLGRMVSATDATSETTRYEYDELGKLVSLTDALNRVTRFEYDAHGNHTAVVDAAEERVTGTYDAQNQLIRITYPDGTSTTYTYDFRGNRLTETDETGRVTRREYDLAGQLIGVTYGYGTVDATTVSYTYDDAGRRTGVTDGLGHTTRYTYDDAGHLVGVTDALSHTQVYTYNVAGQIASAEDEIGRITRTFYDARGRRASRVYPDGSSEQWQYDGAGNLIEAVASCGVVTRYEYDDARQLIQRTYAYGTPDASTTRWGYDGVGRVINETSPLGHVTHWERDAAGQVLTRTAPLGNVTTYAYDQVGQRTSVTDARGNVTEYRYDARGRLTRIEYADDTTRDWVYDDAGRLVDLIDQAGRVTRWGYDGAGRLLSLTRGYGTPDASTEQYHRDVAGRLTGATDPRGYTTTYVYDAANRLQQVIDPLGSATTYNYDAAGQLLSMIDANDHPTQYAYDDVGRLVETLYADSTSIGRTYDCAGRLTGTTDQAGLTTTRDYDDAGRLIAIIDPLSHTTRYDHDLAGNLISVIDANDHETRFVYDELERRTRKTLPDGSFETYDYDAVGNLVSHRLTDGNVNAFSYNSRNRVAQASFFDGQVVDTTYTPTGYRETVTDDRGTTRYVYDDLDRLIGVTQPDGLQVGYTYDAAGNRLSLTTAAGTTSYGYDEVNRLTSVTDPQAEVTTFEYDDVGMLIQKSLPNGITVDYGYDDLNRLTSVMQHDGIEVLASYEYALGLAGNRLSVTGEDGSSIHWTYDDAYRLTGETFRDPGGTILSRARYTYDPVGNRLSETVDGVTTSYSYNALDQLVSKGSTQYTYDGRGNLIGVTDGSDVTQYTWDARDRLSSVTMPGGLDVSYEYDADGRRVRQTAGAEVTNYLWDEASQYGDVVLETDGGGGILASYVLAGTKLVSQRRGGETSYYLHDGQGSVRALADSGGEITDRYTYTAFGEPVAHEGTTENPYRYVAQRFDDLTGLYQMRARYYSAGLGRFLSRDPFEGNLTNPLEINRYVYAANNPINLTDPTGKAITLEYVKTIVIPAATAGAILGAAGGFVAASLFVVVAALGACGAGLQALAFTMIMNPPVLAAYLAKAMAIGAGMGALTAGLIALGPAGMIIAGAISAALGALGLVTSVVDLVSGLKEGYLNICALAQAVLSVVAIVAGVKLIVSGRQLIIEGKDPWGDTLPGDGCTGAGCDGDDDGPPGDGDDDVPPGDGDDDGPPPGDGDDDGLPPGDGDDGLWEYTDEPTGRRFKVGRHGDMPSPRNGRESHHGILSKWMEEVFGPAYNPDDAPAVLMPKEDHNATRGYYNTWRAQQRQAQGGVFSWDKVTEGQIRGLAEGMFGAADTPQPVRSQYWRLFDAFLEALRQSGSP